jgi:hypothetical protein
MTTHDTVAVASDVITASFEDIERVAQRLTALEYRLGMIEAKLSQLLCQPTSTSPEPTEAPTGESTEAPAEEPAEEPTGESTEAPAEEPAEEPAGEPAEEPTGESTEAPPEAPTEAPAEEPTEAPPEAHPEASTEPEVYFSYFEIESELKELAKWIIVQSESDFNPEVNPTGRIYRLPTDAAVIPPAQLERLIVPSKEWQAFARILNLYPTTVWRDPRDREGSNVDYIIHMLHPEGLFFIRMRAVET